MAGWANNAHKVNFVKIYYPFHPFYGQELKVVGDGKGRVVQVKALNGDVRRIPIWMTDKERCRQIKVSPYPYCSLNALKNLRKILLYFTSEQ